jgi:DsbC/DsbD-like thiol-disulfide interchange protein
MNGMYRHLVAAFALFIALGGAARADDGAVPGVESLRLTRASAGGDGVYHAGIDMVMEPGWHTYWRMPGDSGIAPTFDWSASDNLGEVTLSWPAPMRFDLPDDMTVGYVSHVVWPVAFTAKDPSRPVILRLQMRYGICSDICVPGLANLSLDTRKAADAADTELVASFAARVPRAPGPGEVVTARVDGAQFIVTLMGASDTPQLIIEGPKSVWFARPVTHRDAGGLHYAVPVEVGARAALRGADVTLTFSGPETAIETTLKVE